MLVVVAALVVTAVVAVLIGVCIINVWIEWVVDEIRR